MASESVKALPTVKYIDYSIPISTGNKYANKEISVEMSRVIGLAIIYNDDFWGEPIIASIRNNSNNITIITARNGNVTQNRTYLVRVFYI